MAALLDACGAAAAVEGDKLNFAPPGEMEPVVKRKAQASPPPGTSEPATGKRRRVARREWIQQVIAAFRGHLLSNCCVAASTASLYGCLAKSLMQATCDNVIAKGVVPGLQEDFEGVKEVILNHHDVVRDYVLNGKHQRYSAVLSYLARFINGENQAGIGDKGSLGTVPVGRESGAAVATVGCPACGSTEEKGEGVCTLCARSAPRQHVKEAEGLETGAGDEEACSVAGAGSSQAVSAGEASSPVGSLSYKAAAKGSGGIGLSRWLDENRRLQKRMEELEGKCEGMESSRKAEVQQKNRVLLQLQEYQGEIVRLSKAMESVDAAVDMRSRHGSEVEVGNHRRIHALELELVELKRQNAFLLHSHLAFIRGVVPTQDDRPGTPMFHISPMAARAGAIY